MNHLASFPLDHRKGFLQRKIVYSKFFTAIWNISENVPTLLGKRLGSSIIENQIHELHIQARFSVFLIIKICGIFFSSTFLNLLFNCLVYLTLHAKFLKKNFFKKTNYDVKKKSHILRIPEETKSTRSVSMKKSLSQGVNNNNDFAFVKIQFRRGHQGKVEGGVQICVYICVFLCGGVCYYTEEKMGKGY